MEKYFKTYKEAAAYVVENVLIDFQKKIICMEKAQMNDGKYFYKLTVEPYVEKVDPYPWITTTPAVTFPNGLPQVWYETLKPQEPDGYRFTCGQGSSSAMGDTTPLGHNPYQE